jgi:heme exporter protein CcmD
MGGYAVYVWGSVGVTALLLAVEVWQARWAHRVVLNQLKAEQAVAQLPVEELM